MNIDYFKRKLTVNIAIVLVLVIVLLFLLILSGRDIGRRVANIQNLQQELNLRLNALQSLATLRGQSGQAQIYFDSLRNLLPTKDELAGFPKVLSEIAKTNKVELGFSFGAETAAVESQPGFTAFNFTLSSTYDNFINFLKGVERGRYYAGLDSLDVTRESQTGKISALISGKVFSQ